MKDKFSKILLSLGTLVIGICLLLWADKVTTTAAMLFGICLLLYGLVNGLTVYKKEPNNTGKLICQILIGIVGIVLIIKPNIISEIISFVIGIYIMFSSLVSLKSVLDNKSSKKYKMGLILSVSGIVIGFLCILGKLLIPNLILRFLGAALIIYSLIAIINIVIFPNKSK
ncbi:MAG: DUF308 domain-containing protein [Bacilli bacterium]|nr:DUF308 domain-containing protein [Bacilli bacterium]